MSKANKKEEAPDENLFERKRREVIYDRLLVVTGILDDVQREISKVRSILNQKD